MNTINNKSLNVLNQPVPSKQSNSILDVFSNRESIQGQGQQEPLIEQSQPIFSVFSAPKSVKQGSNLFSSPKNQLNQEINGEPKGFIDSINNIFSNKSSPKVSVSSKMESILAPSVSQRESTATPLVKDSMFSGFNWLLWLVILIFVLAFLGINVFTYLAEGTVTASDIIGKVLNYLGITTVKATQQIVETGVRGTEAGVQLVGGATVGAIQGGVQAIKPKSSQPTTPIEKAVTRTYDNKLSKAIDESDKDTTPSPDVARSTAHSSNGGWCYVGDDRGERTCVRIGEDDQCMSGDIFPTQDICINPKLRK